MSTPTSPAPRYYWGLYGKVGPAHADPPDAPVPPTFKLTLYDGWERARVITEEPQYRNGHRAKTRALTATEVRRIVRLVVAMQTPTTEG